MWKKGKELGVNVGQKQQAREYFSNWDEKLLINWLQV